MIPTWVQSLGTNAIQSHASLYLDMFNRPRIDATTGQVPSTNTRATIATVQDWEGVTREVRSGENRFGGMRRVENLINRIAGANSNTLAGSATSNATLTGPDSDGFYTLTRTGAAASWAHFTFGSGAIGYSMLGRSYTARAVFKSVGTMTDFRINVSDTTTTTASSVNLASSLSATPKIFSFFTNAAFTNSGFIGAFGITLNGANGESLAFKFVQCEDVTGQSVTTAGEYQSVGVLSSPFQGANVDGVAYYPYQNGNTVASNVVTEAVGATISSAIRGGFLPEPAATDLLNARADARDMTTANWTLGATMTRARTSVGADGVANKANRLTGGAVAATNIITTTITAAASSRTYSVLIKRVTGTGPVRITQDNFATSTDISSLINSSTYTLVQLNQSQLNAQLGIKIDTNGDAIDADWNQFSSGNLTGQVNSRIPDTITTRNADLVTYATTGWLNANSGSLYAEWFNPNTTNVGIVSSINDNTSNNIIEVYFDSATTKANAIVANGGVTQSLLNTPAITPNTVCKAINIYQANDFAGFVNNTSLGTDVAGTIPAVTQMNVGSRIGGAQPGHYIRRIAYYPQRLDSTTAQSMTV